VAPRRDPGQHAAVMTRRWLCSLALTCLLAACGTPVYTLVLEPAGATGVDSRLRGLSMVDEDVAWASGTDGAIVRTADGGRSWQRVSPPAEGAARDFRDVHAIDERRALVMAIDAPGRIWRTDDAGDRWELVLDDDRDGSFLDAMDLDDDGFGIAWGDPVDGAFACFRTDDGGRSWAPLDTLPRPLIDEAGFAASGTCVVVRDDRVWIVTGGAERARMFRSPDRGLHWLPIDLPLPAGRASAGAFSIALLDDGRAAIVGGDYLQPTRRKDAAAFSATSGLSWLPSIRPPAGYRSCVAAAADDALVAVGTTGIDLSNDSGRTWEPVRETPFHAVAFAPGGRVGLAVGPDGSAVRLRLEPID
jgi:hypothetical protein